MAKSVNKLSLLGNLSRDAETKFTSSGQARTELTVVTNHSYKDKQGDWKDTPTFHDVTLWQSEKLASYLTKGTKVYLEARVDKRSYEDKEGKKRWSFDIIADPHSIILLSVKPVQDGDARPVSEDSTGFAGDDEYTPF